MLKRLAVEAAAVLALLLGTGLGLAAWVDSASVPGNEVTAFVITPGVTGWLLPTAQAAGPGGDGDGFEGTPGNLLAVDNSSARDYRSGTGASTVCGSSRNDTHDLYNFSFSVPAGAHVWGVEVRVVKAKYGTYDDGIDSQTMCASVSRDGGASWSRYALITKDLDKFSVTYSNPTYAFGWTDADVSNANFRLRIANVTEDSGTSNAAFEADAFQVQVWYGP